MFENTESPSQGLTHLSQSSKHSLEDEFLSLTPTNDIQGFKDCKQVIIFMFLNLSYIFYCNIMYYLTFFISLKGNDLCCFWNH